MGGQIAAEGLRVDLGIRRAAAVREQASVVGLRRRLRRDPEPVAQTHRDLRRVEAMLEGKSQREVRGQAQRRHHLRRARALRSRDCLVRHPATVTESSAVPASIDALRRSCHGSTSAIQCDGHPASSERRRFARNASV